MYDVYSITPHNFAFTETSDFITFKNLGRFNEGVMKSTNFNAPKHGAVVHLTTEEADKLEAYWLKNKRKYVSTASIQKNPLFPGYYADPEILYSEQTQKILRLSHDGRYTGMGRHELQGFPSTDLKTWKEERVVLDLRQVSWAKKERMGTLYHREKTNRRQLQILFLLHGREASGRGGSRPSARPVQGQRPTADRGRNFRAE